MDELQTLIQQLLPKLLQQPRSRDQLLSEAGTLYDPYYNEQSADTQYDYSKSSGRLGEDYATNVADLARNQSRGTQDYGTQEQILNRNRADMLSVQGNQQGAQKEQLATMGFGSQPGGIGDYQRNELARQQGMQTAGMNDQFGTLASNRSRFGEDITRQQQGLDTTNTRGTTDLADWFTRQKRATARSRASAIEGYATDPNYMFN
jgi:hypothetical protein